MSRIEATFSALKAQGRKALIPYVTAGFPFADITPALMHGMVEAGADVIELGVPFSDPMADGPVIQKAGEKALSLGIGMVQVLDHVREFRKRNSTTPVVLMGYANPVERYDQKHGAGAFVRDAAAAGVDGVLIVDYPGVGPEHAWLQEIGRAEYVGITDKEALEAFHYLCRTEGIIPALESSHAVAYAMKLAKTMRADQSILVNLSGRGDKDIGTVADLSGADFYCRPSCQGQSVKGADQPVKVVK